MYSQTTNMVIISIVMTVYYCKLSSKMKKLFTGDTLLKEKQTIKAIFCFTIIAYSTRVGYVGTESTGTLAEVVCSLRIRWYLNYTVTLVFDILTILGLMYLHHENFKHSG